MNRMKRHYLRQDDCRGGVRWDLTSVICLYLTSAAGTLHDCKMRAVLTHRPGPCWRWWWPPGEGRSSCPRRRWGIRSRRCSWRVLRSPWQWRCRWSGPKVPAGSEGLLRTAGSGRALGRIACTGHYRSGRVGRRCRWAATTPASGRCHSGWTSGCGEMTEVLPDTQKRNGPGIDPWGTPGQ